MTGLDQARDNLLPKIGASTTTISRAAIEKLPQADNTPIDKVILQLPGVSYDSAVVQSEFPCPQRIRQRANQDQRRRRARRRFRPRPVSRHQFHRQHVAPHRRAAGANTVCAPPACSTSPAEAFAAPGGEVSLYGGSRQTFTPSFDYGGSVGKSEYFVTARGNWNDLGIENPTPGLNAIHDQTATGQVLRLRLDAARRIRPGSA